MPDLADLGEALLPGATKVGRSSGRPISWVRVMKARVPAFDALEAGDLAIVPAAALEVVAPGPAELRAFVDGCLDARLSGLLLVEGESEGDGDGAIDDGDAGRRRVLDELVALLGDAALPALRVARTDPAALERSVIGFLVTRGAEIERQAGMLESRLERLALEGGGPAALVAAIATFLGRAVALEGRRGDALAVHAPAGAPDAGIAVTRYHARPRHAVALRIALPVAGTPASGAPSAKGTAGTTGTTGTAAGSLALLGDRPVGELERVSLGRIAGLLALELSRDEAVRRARDAARRAEALPPAGPPWVVLLARQRIPGAPDDTPEGLERREANRRELRLIAPARRLALRGDADSLEVRAVLAVDPPDGSDPEGLAIAARIATFLGRTVALSSPFASAAERPAAEADARAVLEASEALPGPEPVVRAARLPVYQLLGALHNLRDGERHARTLVAPLLEGRADVRREHLATLRAVLDGGGLADAAGALRVHRNTVAYRLHRIEDLTGWDLADPELRLALLIALRFVQDH